MYFVAKTDPNFPQLSSRSLPSCNTVLKSMSDTDKIFYRTEQTVLFQKTSRWNYLDYARRMCFVHFFSFLHWKLVAASQRPGPGQPKVNLSVKCLRWHPSLTGCDFSFTYPFMWRNWELQHWSNTLWFLWGQHPLQLKRGTFEQVDNFSPQQQHLQSCPDKLLWLLANICGSRSRQT